MEGLKLKKKAVNFSENSTLLSFKSRLQNKLKLDESKEELKFPSLQMTPSRSPKMAA